MNTIKTFLTTSAIVSAFAFSTVQANGFFNVDKNNAYQQPDTFDASIHEGTSFWSYFNNGMYNQTPKMDQVASFDKSRHVGTTFWDYHNH